MKTTNMFRQTLALIHFLSYYINLMFSLFNLGINAYATVFDCKPIDT